MAAQVQAVLTLYSLGALTGLVLDSGDGVTHAVRCCFNEAAAPTTSTEPAATCSATCCSPAQPCALSFSEAELPLCSAAMPGASG